MTAIKPKAKKFLYGSHIDISYTTKTTALTKVES
jgi:hypothetical protein